MIEDEKDFLDDFLDDEPAETPVADASEPARGPQRGPDGKFLKAEAERQAEKAEKGVNQPVETSTAPDEPPSDGEEGTMVPVSVVKKLREELKAAKAAKTTEQSTPSQAPDFGPPGQDVEARLLNMRLNMSAEMAGMVHGQDTVAKAWAAFDEACNREPHTGEASIMSKALVNHPHPIAQIIKWYERDQQIKAIQQAGGLDAYVEAQLAQRLAQQRPEPAPASPARPRTPPSLAGRSGGTSRSASGDVFDELFNS